MAVALGLSEAFPELAAEIEQLLKRQNENALAAQVRDLKVCDRCRCGDDFCASMYTLPAPRGAYEPNHNSFDLDAERGMIMVDVVDGRIAHLEILDRDEIRQRLLALLP